MSKYIESSVLCKTKETVEKLVFFFLRKCNADEKKNMEEERVDVRDIVKTFEYYIHRFFNNTILK